MELVVSGTYIARGSSRHLLSVVRRNSLSLINESFGGRGRVSLLHSPARLVLSPRGIAGRGGRTGKEVDGGFIGIPRRADLPHPSGQRIPNLINL